MLSDEQFLEHFNDEFFGRCDAPNTARNSGLEEYARFSQIAVESGEYDSISPYYPTSATLNPTVILHAIQENIEYQEALEALTNKVMHEKCSQNDKVQMVLDNMLVFWARRTLENIHGHLFLQIDPRLGKCDERVQSVKRLRRRFQECGVQLERIVFGIITDEEGLKAIKILEDEEIHCIGTLCFCLKQAADAAKAGATYVNTCVGSVHKFWRETDYWSYTSDSDLGVILTNRVLSYIHKNHMHTKVVASSLQNMRQCVDTCGCDIVAMSLPLMQELEKMPRYKVRDRVVRDMFVMPMELHGSQLPFDARMLLEEGIVVMQRNLDKIAAMVSKMVQSKSEALAEP